MTLCDKDCIPCCDYCMYCFHEWIEITNGNTVKGEPLGCFLHKDIEHEYIVKSNGFCNDFWCMNAKERQHE